MQRKTNNRGFVSHAIFRALSVFVFAALINLSLNFSTHALPSISVSSDNNVTITGDDIGGYVAPTPAGALGVGVDHVNVTTDCSSGYRLYVSGTSTSSTDLVREDAEDQALESNRISTSSTAVGSESALAKNTWGVGKNGTDFAKIQDYSLNPGTWTPLYTGTDNSTFNVYYGLNISMGKEPGIYSGEVLYTAILDEACLKYTLNFDTSSATTVDSTVFESKSIEYGSNVDLSEYSATSSISRTGYTLAGWGYNIDEIRYEFVTNASVDINTTDLREITLSPVWTPITYNLIYDAGETGGTCSELSVPVAYDSDVTLASVICTKTGHTQDGWSASQLEDNEKDYDLEQILEHPNFTSTEGDSYTIYPHFSINKHALTINSDPTAVASTSPESGEVEYNTEITATCVANTGYHCAGWTSENQEVLPDSSLVEYTFNMPDNPVTLTANANPNTYTIRYNANGGTGETDSQTGQAYGSTTILQESGFLRAGHHFIGWAYSDSAETPDFTSGQTEVSVAELAENNAAGSVVDTNGGTIDLYALWDINNYTFVFDTNGGTGYPASASSSASYEGSIVPPGVGTMEKTNYEFIGWSLDPSAGTEDYSANTAYSVSTIVSAAGKANENDAEIILYASWSGLPFTLRTVNGNTAAISSISPDTTGTTKRFGSSVTVSCTPNSGYHCTGWTSSDTDKLPSSSNASYTFSMPEDITLTANGAVNTYTIRYNANGGSGSTDSQTGQSYGSTTTLRSNGFSRTGYSFSGWAYSPSASSRDFTANQSNVSVSTLAANNYSGSVVNTNGGTIDLYAVWTGNNYTIAYSAGSTGGSCSVSSTSATYGSYATLSSSTCSKAGYHQDGWSTTNSSSNSKNYDLGGSAYNLTTSGTTYLYPHFVPNTYTIKYTSYGAPYYSHTPNISDTGSQSGQYSNNMDTNEVITVPNASKLKITLTYQTESTSYDWVSLWAGNYPSYRASSDYSSGLKLGSNTDGKYGGTTKTTVEGTISGNTVTFGFRSDTSVTNYGYYAVITPLDSSGNPLSNVTGATTSQTVNYDETVTLRSNGFSRDGYAFQGWSFSQNTSTASYYAGSSYAVSSLASAASVTNTNGGVITLWAAWQQQVTYYTLSISNGYLGSSGTSTSGSYAAGSTVTIRASSPGSNYSFSYWSSNNGGSFASQYSTTTTFTMPSKNVTVTANYTYSPPATYYSLNVSNGYIGTSGTSTSSSYTSGTTVNIRANIPSGATFSYWSSNNGGSFGNQYSANTTFTMPSGNVTITANYTTPTYYTLTVINGYVGSSGTSTSTSQTAGTSVTIRASVPSGNTFTSWSSNNGGTFASSTSSTTTFTMPSRNVTVTAGYKSNTKYMQDSSVCSTLSTGTTTTLRDSRDNQDYTVYRWGSSSPSNMSNYCIMTQDLALGYTTGGSITRNSSLSLSTSTSAGSGTITARSGTSDWSTTSSDTNLQYINGTNSHVYYTYGSAQKVCPKGWRPPTKTEFANIATFMGGNNRTGSNTIRSAPYNFQFSGLFNPDDGFSGVGSKVRYWASTQDTNSLGDILTIDGSTLKVHYGSKYYGYSVRCVQAP